MYASKKPNIHAVRLGYVTDMQRSRDGSSGGCLLFVVGKALAGKKGASTLRNLKDDWSLDIPTAHYSRHIYLEKKTTHLAASNTAFAVEEEVTFCPVDHQSNSSDNTHLKPTYNRLQNQRRQDSISSSPPRELTGIAN